jgi:hypothetical protein
MGREVACLLCVKLRIYLNSNERVKYQHYRLAADFAGLKSIPFGLIYKQIYKKAISLRKMFKRI